MERAEGSGDAYVIRDDGTRNNATEQNQSGSIAELLHREDPLHLKRYLNYLTSDLLVLDEHNRIQLTDVNKFRIANELVMSEIDRVWGLICTEVQHSGGLKFMRNVYEVSSPFVANSSN
ncbi:unnamed protein product [Gongylonema pulchrum]|uniref:Uncharacterized protein n=1 Tax=Gongylonema pulchrum TaxID=637853 RepID=A0A183EKR8_9BILA|nr:unnamed protein product [Gongylonema pulchrum]VDN38501.1 unnamed protein product [Gongylonema pulchrum]